MGRIAGGSDAAGSPCPICGASVVREGPRRPGIDWRGLAWLIVFGFVAWVLLRWVFYSSPTVRPSGGLNEIREARVVWDGPTCRSGSRVAPESGRLTPRGGMAESSGAPLAPLVLVADDEAEILELVREVLGQAGFRTITATDGEEVVDLALTRRPDVIVLDVMMPKLDGYTTLTRLRGHPRTRDIPVIVLTAQEAPVYRTLSFGVGAVAHVTKPFSPRRLAELVARVLEPRST